MDGAAELVAEKVFFVVWSNYVLSDVQFICETASKDRLL
jgi:hypothetical protein